MLFLKLFSNFSQMIIKPVLRSHIKEDGTTQINIYIYSQGKKTYIPTEYYIKPEHWEKGRVKAIRPNADYINSQLSDKVAELERTWLIDKQIGAEGLKRKKVHKSMSLFEFVEHFIKGIKDKTILIGGKITANKAKEYSKNTTKIFDTNYNYYKRFNPNLNWRDINEEFFSEFIVWMRDQSYAENTITRAIKVLIVIMRRGGKHHSNTDYLSFSTSYVESEAVVLNEAEIELIMNAKLKKNLHVERDRFYLSYNFFLRFGDSLKIEKSDVFKQKGKYFARVTDQKTKNKSVIPLLPRSLGILKKYNYQLPKTANQVSNRYLKDIGKAAGIDEMVTETKIENGQVVKNPCPKWTMITTHTARRSVATNMYLAGVDLKSIQLMGGWKSIAMLEKYIKVGKLQNAINVSEHPFFN